MRAPPEQPERPRPKKRLSLSEYARHRGVSLAAVQKAVRDGRLSKCLGTPLPRSQGSPSIDPLIANQEWSENTHPGNQRSAAPDPSLDASGMLGKTPDGYRRAMTVKATIEAQIAAIDLQKLQETVVDAAMVKTETFRHLRRLRDRVFETAERCCEELASSKGDARACREILLREYREIFDQQADAP